MRPYASYRDFTVRRWLWVACWKWGACFRLFGHGLHLRRIVLGETLVFSERYGYTTVWKFAGWRVTVLKP